MSTRDIHFDGGETGCGELLLGLLLFMRGQPAGAIVNLRALDPGAPLEIPAWCRLTKHALLAADHPFYTIHKPDPNQTKPNQTIQRTNILT